MINLNNNINNDLYENKIPKQENRQDPLKDLQATAQKKINTRISSVYENSLEENSNVSTSSKIDIQTQFDDDFLIANFSSISTLQALKKINELKIADELTLVKIAKILARNDIDFSKSIKRFNIKKEKSLIDIAMIAAEVDPSFHRSFPSYGITDQEASIKLAGKLASHKFIVLNLRKFKNFNIQNQVDLINILKINLQNYKFIQGEPFFAPLLNEIADLEIKDPDAVFELIVAIEQDISFENEDIHALNFPIMTSSQMLAILLATLKGFEVDPRFAGEGLPYPFDEIFNILPSKSDEAYNETLKIISETFPDYISSEITTYIQTFAKEDPLLKADLTQWLVYTIGSISLSPLNLNEFFKFNLIKEILECRSMNLRGELSFHLSKIFQDNEKAAHLLEFLNSTENSKHALLPAIILAQTKINVGDDSLKLLEAIKNSREFRHAFKRDLLLNVLNRVQREGIFSQEDKNRIFNLLISEESSASNHFKKDYPFLTSYLDNPSSVQDLRDELSKKIILIRKKIKNLEEQQVGTSKAQREEVSKLAKNIKALERENSQLKAKENFSRNKEDVPPILEQIEKNNAKIHNLKVQKNNFIQDIKNSENGSPKQVVILDFCYSHK